MISRTILLSLILAAGHSAADGTDSSPSSLHNLRHLAAETASSASSEDVPDIEDARSLQEDSSEDIPDVEDARYLQDAISEDVPAAADATDAGDEDASVAVAKESTERVVVEETVTIPPFCFNNLAAAANKNPKLGKDNYFVFTDGMANGYFNFNNMTSYDDLPVVNKFGFVTLSCQCTQFGGRDNCCQAGRARIDVTGIEDPDTMTIQLQRYIKDICTVTADAIGDKVLPPSGELPTTAKPTTSVPPTSSPSHSPTNAPVVAPTPDVPETPTPDEPTVPEIGEPEGGKPDGDRSGDGLDNGAWAGIAIAGAVIVTLAFYVITDRKQVEDELAEDDDLDQMSRADGGKELVNKEILAITANGEMELAPDRPPRVESPDATNSLTSSDVSSIPSEGNSDFRSTYYATNALLPRPDEDSLLSPSDGPSFFSDCIEEGMVVTSPNNLSHSANLDASGPIESSGDSLDQAIESGNWEAVAASAAAFVNRDGESPPPGGDMSV